MKSKAQLIVGLGLALAMHTSAATVIQSPQFKGVTPERLYQIYLSSEEHGAFTGAPAQIDPREGGEVRAFGGAITGKIYQLVPGRLIVQKWRGGHSKPTDLDSTLILTFRKTGQTGTGESGAEIEVVHANVPDDERALVDTSWYSRYWLPLMAYAKAHPSSK